MSSTPRITLLGADRGKIKAVSEPLEVYRLTDAASQDAECVTARFVMVPPRIEHMCRAIAAWYCRKLLGEQTTESDIEEEKRLLMVSYALRVDDGSNREQVFPFPNVLDAKGVEFKPHDDLFMLVRDSEIHTRGVQTHLLFTDYANFVETQFPSTVDRESLAALLDDAKKKSLATLLSDHGYWKVVRLARGLVSLRVA